MITALDIRFSIFKALHTLIRIPMHLSVFVNDPLTAVDIQAMQRLGRYLRVVVGLPTLDADAMCPATFYLRAYGRVVLLGQLPDPRGAWIRETSVKIRQTFLHARTTANNLIGLYAYSQRFGATDIAELNWDAVCLTTPPPITYSGLIYEDGNAVREDYEKDPMEVSWTAKFRLWMPEHLRGELGVA